MLKLGVIGYGSRIGNVIRRLIEEEPSCRIAAIVDPRSEEIKRERSDLSDVRFYGQAEEMLAEEKLDGVLIGTRCSLHTEMALKVLPSGIPLYLEKPVSTTYDDLYRLKEAYERHPSEVVVSFPLRLTRMIQLVKEIVDSGRIGTVEHVQAVNNTPYGAVYFQNWYRDVNETGGLFLQKATHDFDYINYVLGQKPVSVCAMTSKQIFNGSKPAGLKCVDCEENRTCEDSTAFWPSPKREKWAYCAYAADSGNEDSGSAIVRYESGMHVTYSQSFFVRRKAGARGARFMGYKGTIEFDFFASRMKVYMHHSPRVETIEFEAANDHFGGDTQLVRNFANVMQGREKSRSPLDDGLLSALMCLKARESAQTGTFQTIAWDRGAER